MKAVLHAYCASPGLRQRVAALDFPTVIVEEASIAAELAIAARAAEKPDTHALTDQVAISRRCGSKFAG
jgi:hypothetical protein